MAIRPLERSKPAYQPGQTIHMRALMLNRMSLKPCANHPIQFEVSDDRLSWVTRDLLKVAFILPLRVCGTARSFPRSLCLWQETRPPESTRLWR